MSVIIFSREIRSGKTSELFNWLIDKKDVAGILMPDHNGKRMFYDIKERTFFPAQAEPGQTTNIIEVGAYVFDINAFAKANEVLEKTLSSPHAWIVIDEVGKLEINDKGFSKILRSLIGENLNLLIVVRSSLVDVVKEKFSLESSRIISSLEEL
jgi:nucleoside-triphosphatase